MNVSQVDLCMYVFIHNAFMEYVYILIRYDAMNFTLERYLRYSAGLLIVIFSNQL